MQCVGEFAGLGTNTLYQLLWTLPQWDALVTKHMARHDTTVWYAVALLLAFGALFHLHRSVQEAMMVAFCLCCAALCCAVYTKVALRANCVVKLMCVVEGARCTSRSCPFYGLSMAVLQTIARYKTQTADAVKLPCAMCIMKSFIRNCLNPVLECP